MKIARQTAIDIGYNSTEVGFDGNMCAVLTAIEPQSADISQGVTEGEGLHKEQGAGDQGLMFGFACDETPEVMPLPIAMAHRLMENLTKLRKARQLDFLRPDAKSQVTVRYVDGRPVEVDGGRHLDPAFARSQIRKNPRVDHRRADQEDDSRAVPDALDRFTTSIRPAASSSADRMAIADSPAAR